ncbi:hypothetical protein J2Z23_004000 [Lederbergia galactosidilyticus]|nr:hypothetical protein [Lederbergia galactosidilytica]
MYPPFTLGARKVNLYKNTNHVFFRPLICANVNRIIVHRLPVPLIISTSNKSFIFFCFAQNF